MLKPIIASLLLTTVAFSSAAPTQAQCLPGMCGFTENGKKGLFIQTKVKPKNLAKADETIAKSKADGTLAAGSIDRGELYGHGLQMPQTEAALEAMIDGFRPHWPHRQPGAIDVKIVATYGFSPLAHADNVVVVPMGVLLKATSDDEVAWLLAHEFSHLALGHFERQAKARKREKFMGNAISVLQGGAAVASSRFSFNSNGLQQRGTDQKLLQKLSTGIFSKSEDLRLLSTLLNDFFSRKQEDQADVAGLDLALAKGYSDSGASLAIEQLGNEDAERKNLFAAIGEDMTAFGKVEGGRMLLAATQKNMSLKDQGGGLLNNLLGNLKTIAVDKLTNFYKASHRPAEPRREGVLKYFERAYPDGELRDTSTQWLDVVRANPEVTAAKKMLDARQDALELVAAGDAAAAIKVLGPAMKRTYGNSPVLLNTAATIFADAGNPAEADRIYTRAMNQQNDAANQYLAQSQAGFVDHVTLLVTMGNLAKAQQVIETGVERFGDDHAFLPQKVRIAMKSNDMDLLLVTMQRCGDVGDEALSNECEFAIFGPEAEAAYAALTPLEKEKLNNARGLAQQQAQTGGFLKSLTKGMKGLTGTD